MNNNYNYNRGSENDEPTTSEQVLNENNDVEDDNGSQNALLNNISISPSMEMNKIKYNTPEDVLAKFGCWNSRLLFIVFSMAAIWGITAMPLMVTAFAVKGIECKVNNTDCQDEARRYYSIVDQFKLSNFWAESYFSSFFIGNMVFGTILAYLADM